MTVSAAPAVLTTQPVLLPATLSADGTISTGETILFAVVALITVTCGLGLLTAKRAVSAAANMIGIMICLAILYVASDASFLGITQIVVYTGAVMTLVLFVIMMVGVGGEEPVATTGSPSGRWVVAALGAGLAVILAVVVWRSVLPVSTDDGGTVTTTPTHRFWVQGAGWTKAEDLVPGDRLRATAGPGAPPDTTENPHTTDPADGDTGRAGDDPHANADGAVVVESAPTGRTATVHNLTIHGLTNYYITTTTGTRALVHNEYGTQEIVYRALAETDDPAVGLVARAPGSIRKPIGHVAGAKETPWISTTRELSVAQAYNAKGGFGIVKIDLSKVTTEVVDLSDGIPGYLGTTLSNWAKKSAEVLIHDHIPPEAIIPILGGS